MRILCGTVLASVFAVFPLFAEHQAPADEKVRDCGDKVYADVPLAPIEYRRPEGWKPNRYPKTLLDLARDESAAMRSKAAEHVAKVRAVNARGRWKPTGKSIDEHRCPEWFQDAKLGIFIDWGLWSVASWCPYRASKRMYPDWYELRMYYNFDPSSPFYRYRDYHVKNWGEDFERDDFIALFKAERFDAEALCGLFRDCGAKYVVPFTKHHSGFCLWDSSFTHRDVVDQGPRRDIAGEIVLACRRDGLKFGFYVSTGEWEYPLLKEDGSVEMMIEYVSRAPYSRDMETKASGKVAVRDYVNDYSIPQLAEFIDKYDPDILWYDYDWVDDAVKLGTYDVAAYFYNQAEGRKEVAVNDRYGNGAQEDIAGKFPKGYQWKWLRTIRGDFYTDELGDTAELINPAKHHPWECCRGISMAFGNHWADCEENVISERDFICEFADIVSKGGNLLFVVNLDGQGAIPEVQRRRLLQIGEWLKINGEAIYATRIVAPYSTPDVDYTRSKDGDAIYAIVKNPKSEVTLQCDLPEGVVVTDVATGRTLSVCRSGRGLVVSLPPDIAASRLPIAIKCAKMSGDIVGEGVVASEPSAKQGVVAICGDVEVVCRRSDGWRFALRETRVEDGVRELELELSRDEPAEPPTFRIEVVSPITDMECRWTPAFGCIGRIPPPEWTTWHAVQRTMPLAQRMNGSGRNRVLVAIDEIRKDIVADCGIDENDFTVRDRFSFFDGIRDSVVRYAVRIRVDRRDVACSCAVAEAARWISSSAGAPPPMKAPTAAFKPLYSTWYGHHLDIGAEKLERELALATSLGMETVIIDAGWSIDGETDDWKSGCGDWHAAHGRFPDMAGHVRRVHALGMKCLLWCAIPFVDRQSEAYGRFSGKFLYEFGARKTAVLDPRFPDVREHLARTCETMVREWGLDGLKLDFIDQIETRGRRDPAVADGFAGRDCRTVAEGVERLMTEISRRLVAVRPDVMIEFRPAYFGPVMQSCGNMMRVADCPGQLAANRVGTVNLRLLCPESAVHSDMIKWNAGDSPEEAARYILSSIFGVIQYSAVLETLPKAHVAMLRHWIDFTRRHESALLHGELVPYHPERDYPVVVGSDAHERIVLVSGAGEVAEVSTDRRTIVLNNTGAGELLLRTDAAAVAEVFDTYGARLGVREVKRGLNVIEVPPSGYIQFVR